MFFDERSHHRKHHTGSIEIICGSMFSGKTEELLRRLRRVVYASKNVLIFKPEVDERYAKDHIVSHDKRQFGAVMVQKSEDIYTHLQGEKIEVVAIDEVQFFDEGLIALCDRLANESYRIILAGLDMDYTGKPFGIVPQLMAKADYVTKLHAICVHCGDIAQFTYRKTNEQEQTLIGAYDAYEPRCRYCYFHT